MNGRDLQQIMSLMGAKPTAKPGPARHAPQRPSGGRKSRGVLVERTNRDKGNARAGEKFAVKNVGGGTEHLYKDPKTGKRKEVFVKGGKKAVGRTAAASRTYKRVPKGGAGGGRFSK